MSYVWNWWKCRIGKLKRETRLIASVHDLYQFYVRLRFIHVGAIHELPLQRSFG